MLALPESHFAQHHSHRLRLETTAPAEAERIVAAELQRLRWNQGQLAARPKADRDKLAIAVRLRREITLTVMGIAQPLHCGRGKALPN